MPGDGPGGLIPAAGGDGAGHDRNGGRQLALQADPLRDDVGAQHAPDLIVAGLDRFEGRRQLSHPLVFLSQRRNLALQRRHARRVPHDRSVEREPHDQQQGHHGAEHHRDAHQPHRQSNRAGLRCAVPMDHDGHHGRPRTHP